MSHKLKGVIWDLDGTLIDSDLYIVANYLHMYEKYRPGYYPHLREIIGFSGPSVTETLTRQFPDVPMEEKMKEFVSFSLKNEPKYLTLYKGEMETLKGLKELGIHQCVFTNKKTASARNCLDSFGITGLFDAVIALDDVERPKPDPDGVYKCLKAMGLKPEEALIIGDSGTDLKAGLASGCPTGLVTWSLKGLPSDRRDYEFDSMSDILKLFQEAL